VVWAAVPSKLDVVDGRVAAVHARGASSSSSSAGGADHALASGLSSERAGIDLEPDFAAEFSAELAALLDQPSDEPARGPQFKRIADVNCVATEVVTGRSTGPSADCVRAALLDVGVPEGEFGGMISAYQGDQGLVVDGIAGRQTHGALGLTNAPPQTAPAPTTHSTDPPSSPTAKQDPSVVPNSAGRIVVPAVGLDIHIRDFATASFDAYQRAIDECNGAILFTGTTRHGAFAAHRTECGSRGFGALTNMAVDDIAFVDGVRFRLARIASGNYYEPYSPPDGMITFVTSSSGGRVHIFEFAPA
jgi:hypothetical protein